MTVLSVVRNEFVLISDCALFLPTGTPDETLQPRSIRLRPGCTEEPAQHLQAVRPNRKIDLAVHLRNEIDQPSTDRSGFRTESLDDGFNQPSFVASVMINRRIGIVVCLLNEHLPDRSFIVGRVRPVRIVRSDPMVADEETDEVRELLIWNALDIQK